MRSSPCTICSALIKLPPTRKRLRRSAPLRKLGAIERDILNELSLGDVLYAFLLSARSTKRFHSLARERAIERYRRKRAVERLLRDSYVTRHGDHVRITRTGRDATRLATARARRLLKKETWDRRWRIVVFDIPEDGASLRKRIRGILKKAGFIRLQQSVWIFPHACEELAHILKELSLEPHHVLYGTLESIEGAEQLKKQFGLGR